ncbi:MAG: DUF3426 domain-containing protein [Oceanicaulis sp.]
MIVTCPSCEAKYRVEQSALEARGGRVRCAACAHVWTVEDEALTLSEPAEAPAPKPEPRPEPQPEPAPEPEFKSKPHAAIRARAADRARKTRLAVEGAGWAGVAACLAVVLGAAFLFRVDVVQAWPRAAGAYAAVGLDVDPVGLAVENLDAQLTETGEGPVLVVEGVVRNTIGRDRRLSPLKAQILDAGGAVLAEWPVALESPYLVSGASERFRTTFPAPPEGGVRVEVVLDG